MAHVTIEEEVSAKLMDNGLREHIIYARGLVADWHQGCRMSGMLTHTHKGCKFGAESGWTLP